MYAFIDRPVTSLNRGGRLLIWSMRQWVQAMAARRCPFAAIGPAFHSRKLTVALPHFHMMMVVLNQRSLDNLGFCPPSCDHIGEHEALILSLVCAMRDRPAEQVRGTAELIVAQSAVPNLLIAMAALGRGLADNGTFPAAPVTDPSLWR